MSEERRKRQEARQGGANKQTQVRKIVVYAIILVLFICVYLAGRLSAGRTATYYRRFAGWYEDLTARFHKNKYDSFAKCLTNQNAKMYGLYWCSHCADQKREFGSSFHFVTYIECASENNPRDLTPSCKDAGVTQFPSWQFGGEPPKAGVLTLETLSQKTGCSLP